jgi:RES domain
MKAYRFNFIGQAAWYLGCDVQTAAVEVLRKPQPKRPFAVATVRILERLPVLDLRRGLWGENPAGNWILKEVVSRRFVSEPTDEVDDSRPQYRIPQYVADLARRRRLRGILYDSTRPSAYNNPEAFGYNLVVFDPVPRYELVRAQLMEFGESDGEGFALDRWPLTHPVEGPAPQPLLDAQSQL